MGPTVGSNELEFIHFDADTEEAQVRVYAQAIRLSRVALRIRSKILIIALLFFASGAAWALQKKNISILHADSRLSPYQTLIARELHKEPSPGDDISVADAGAVILPYTEPSLWDRYHWYFAIGCLVIALQTILILNLAIEGRKRKESEKSMRELAGRLIHAQEEERRRIAGDLHDDVSQRLALVCLQLDMMRGSPPSSTEVLVRELSLLYDETDMISSDIHQFARELHPAILERLGLASALRRHSAEFSSHRKIDVGVQIRGEQIPLNHETALALFRVGQESLMNIAKHSGVSSCSLRLSYTSHRITLEVEDNGKGFERKDLQEKSGLGIESMRERLRSVGGELHIDSVPSQGTRIRAEVVVIGPINKEPHVTDSREEQTGIPAL